MQAELLYQIIKFRRKTVCQFREEKCIISPYFDLSGYCVNLESQIRILEQSGINVLHVDILDGHFSPSMPLGLDISKAAASENGHVF